MSDTRTVDNLGIEASNRFAFDQAAFDDKYIKDSSAISSQARSDVLVPFFIEQTAQLFDMQQRNAPDAEFIAPAELSQTSATLFTYMPIPSLGSDDKLEQTRDKIVAHMETDPNEIKSAESEKLLTFFDRIESINRDHREIANKRNQYSKG